MTRHWRPKPGDWFKAYIPAPSGSIYQRRGALLCTRVDEWRIYTDDFKFQIGVPWRFEPADERMK